jgi:hypothetical protein
LRAGTRTHIGEEDEAKGNLSRLRKPADVQDPILSLRKPADMQDPVSSPRISLSLEYSIGWPASNTDLVMHIKDKRNMGEQDMQISLE